MIDEEIKRLIKIVENLLKTDERFAQNGDNMFKKHMKHINKETKMGINNIPILFNPLNNIRIPMQQQVVTKEVIREVPKEVIRLVKYCPKEQKDKDIVKSISTNTSEMGTMVEEQKKPEERLDFTELNRMINSLNIANLQKELDQVNKEVQQIMS
jgi:hypothetical protein